MAAWRSWGPSWHQNVTEEARTHGFPSPSLDGFGFVDICCDFFIHLAAGKNLIVNIIGLFQATENVRFGSLAAPLVNISLMSASRGKAVVREWSFGGVILNVSFHQKRTVDQQKNRGFDRALSAISGR